MVVRLHLDHDGHEDSKVLCQCFHYDGEYPTTCWNGRGGRFQFFGNVRIVHGFISMMLNKAMKPMRDTPGSLALG